MLVRAYVVVPAAEDAQLGPEVVDFGIDAFTEQPPARLEGSEEPLDPAVLPRRQLLDALVLEFQNAQAEPEKPRGEDGLVVCGQFRFMVSLQAR